MNPFLQQQYPLVTQHNDVPSEGTSRGLHFYTSLNTLSQNTSPYDYWVAITRMGEKSITSTILASNCKGTFEGTIMVDDLGLIDERERN